MSSPKFSMEREEEARRKARVVTGLTQEIADEITQKIANIVMEEAGKLYDELYPHLKHDRLRKTFILAISVGVQDIIVKETGK